MPSIKIISHVNEITLGNQWTSSVKFDSKNRIVDETGRQVDATHQGRKYYIIEKRERAFSGLERFGRGLLAVVATVCTLFSGAFSKLILNLYTKPKATIRYAIPISTEQAQLIQAFSPQMVHALGGIEKVEELPKLEMRNGVIDLQQLTAPVSIGYHQNGDAFLVFYYLKWTEHQMDQCTVEPREGKTSFGNSTTSVTTQTVFRFEPVHAYLKRTHNSWQYDGVSPHELNLRSVTPIKDGSLAEQHMLKKISRLMNGEAIGVLKAYGVGFQKPKEKATYTPDDAYLQGDELAAYMDIDTLFYETMPEEGTTDVFLCNPKLSRSENIQAMQKAFPVMQHLRI